MFSIYASRLSPEGSYTPQMVLNGRDQFVGSDGRALERALLCRSVNTGEEYGSFQPRLFQYVTCSLMPTISCPAFVCFRLICRRRASAGGQLEHPSEVKSSTIATEDGG